MDEKDFYMSSYIDTLFRLDIPTINYKELKLIPSRTAIREMTELGLDILDCNDMLKNGYDAPRRRGRFKEEKWFDAGNKTYNIVIVRSYNYFFKEDVYLIIHVGKFTKR